ncbi:MAG: exopolyphosphatase / guanosine-5-triphosphate,3-diphosphate pyrophosphatase [Actinomycetota bacterium]|jgi:exopolyphosphatase/guanosine-5'-triphosphate,3'-diphosphate pyrophosphatase
MTVVAAVDCGTNSTRLLISDGATVFERRMVITRLGQGVNASGKLDPSAIARTTDVLGEYRALMDKHGVTAARVTATSAARDASNRDEFFGAAELAIGVLPELLSGDEEGRLSFAGATAELDPHDGPFLVVDIGGGSTELVVGGSDVEGACSLDIGCVRLTEQFLESDPPAAEELSNAVGYARDTLEEARLALPVLNGGRTLVGLAGTVSAVAAIEQGLHAYDRDRIHHFLLTKAAAEDVFRTVATEKLSDRIHNPGLERERADVIVGGAVILVSVMRVFGFQECLVSEADILDGLVMSLLA